MNSSIKKFGDRLKYVLDDKKESINIFSKKLNIGEEVIEEYIKNTTFPSWQSLINIATELNVSTDFLLGISNDYKNEKNIFIGIKLQETLSEKKISKEFIIENSTLSYNEFNGILNNEISPKLDVLIKLSKLLEVSCDYLLGVSNDYKDEKNVYIGDSLQETLRIRKISKEFIIENTELSCDEFDMILNNRISTKLEILLKLSKLLKVSSDYLLGLSNDIKDNEIVLKYKCKNISLTKESIQNILNSIEYLNWNIHQNNDE